MPDTDCGHFVREHYFPSVFHCKGKCVFSVIRAVPGIYRINPFDQRFVLCGNSDNDNVLSGNGKAAGRKENVFCRGAAAPGNQGKDGGS
jgi:hypothetical protein